MVGGKVFSYPENFRLYKVPYIEYIYFSLNFLPNLIILCELYLIDHFQVLIAAKYGGHDLKLDEDFEFGTTNKGPSEIFLTLDDNFCNA